VARDIALRQSTKLSTCGPLIEGIYVLEYGESVEAKGK
jgi:hypothetical protein